MVPDVAGGKLQKGATVSFVSNGSLDGGATRRIPEALVLL